VEILTIIILSPDRVPLWSFLKPLINPSIIYINIYKNNNVEILVLADYIVMGVLIDDNLFNVE